MIRTRGSVVSWLVIEAKKLWESIRQLAVEYDVSTVYEKPPLLLEFHKDFALLTCVQTIIKEPAGSSHTVKQLVGLFYRTWDKDLIKLIPTGLYNVLRKVNNCFPVRKNLVPLPAASPPPPLPAGLADDVEALLTAESAEGPQ